MNFRAQAGSVVLIVVTIFVVGIVLTVLNFGSGSGLQFLSSLTNPAKISIVPGPTFQIDPIFQQVHYECKYNRCVKVNGPGTNQCSPAILKCIPTVCTEYSCHNECQNLNCVLVHSPGVNQCNSNANCRIPCSDSDGINPDTLGTCTDYTGTYSDSCFDATGDSVVEYYCSNNQCVHQRVFCYAEKLCSKGACVLPQLRENFDWRNVHSENWMTPVKNVYQTACWASGNAGTIEAYINLYYNQHLDIDLSEQQISSCAGAGCTVPPFCLRAYWPECDFVSEFYPDLEFPYCIEKIKGITEESCAPYHSGSYCGAECCNASNICVDWQEKSWKISDYLGKFSGWANRAAFVNELKRTIIEKGPTQISLQNWPPYAQHTVVCVGFEKDPISGEDKWIIKNIFGEGWGQNGYETVPEFYGSGWHYVDQAYLVPIGAIIPPDSNSNLQINCVDNDNDGYCNWGISPAKPVSCPASCKAEKDCDDSNPDLGPFDDYLNCIPI